MTCTPSDRAQPPVYGLDHSAYRCRDAEQTRAFYEDALGFPLALATHIGRLTTTRAPFDGLHIFFDIGSCDPGKPSHIAFFEVFNLPGDNPNDLFRKRRGIDLHFAMRVADHAALDTWKARLESKGVEVEGPIDHGVLRSIYFHDPNGYRLEFASAEAKEQQRFREEGAQAHKRMAQWAEWKKTGHLPAVA